MKQDEPNLVLPLAASYNTRGIDAYTNAVTNTLDQRKVNSMYVPIVNEATGKLTLYLTKRPGHSIRGQTYGSSGQVAHLVEVSTDLASSGTGAPASFWVFSTSGNDIQASDDSGTTVVVTAAGYKPAFVELTDISGARTCVLQIRNTTFANRVFYATARNSWTEVTDTDFTGLTIAGKLEFLDGYAFVMDFNNRIYNSDVNSVSSWPASSYLTKSITQDLPRGLAKLGQQIIAFGRHTMEVFRNAGNPTGSPLQRVAELEQRYGITRTNLEDFRNYYCRLGQRIFWVSPAPSAVLAYDGMKVERVSNPAIERYIEDNSGVIYGVFKLKYCGEEAVAISLTTTAATTQRWLMFFPNLKEWFEWTSTVVCPTSASGEPAILLGVGTNQHRLYEPAFTDNWADNGTNYDRVHQFELPKDGAHRKSMRWLGLAGVQERSACTETVQVSDDDGQNWTTLGTIDCTADRQYLYRCGSYRRRLVRLTNSTSHERRIEKFFARVE